MPIIWDDDDPPALSAANLNEWGTQLGARELGYAEITSNATSTDNFGAETDVSGLTVTVTVGSRPIIVCFWGIVFNTTAGDRAIVYIKEGTTNLVSSSPISSAASQENTLYLKRRLAPSAGSHTYKVMLSRLSAGTATIGSPAGARAHIQVIEV